jgi:proline iminopeptidase
VSPDLPVIELANLTELPDGGHVEWEAVGAGDPLIWIEGGPGFPAHLGRPDVALLSRWFRCYLVNAPGCGRTSPPRDPANGYSLPGHVAFFDRARAALGLDRVTLAGHSWGGLVAPAWAATHPDRIERLIVIDGYAGGSSVDQAAAEREREAALDRVRDRPWFGTARAALDAAFAVEHPTEQELCRAFAPAWPLYFSEPDSPRARVHIDRMTRELRFNVDVVETWERDYEGGDYRELLARVPCPTLIVVGEHDFICGPTWNRSLAAVIPGARYVQIADAGHMPHYEQQEAVTAALEDWLAGA